MRRCSGVLAGSRGCDGMGWLGLLQVVGLCWDVLFDGGLEFVVDLDFRFLRLV